MSSLERLFQSNIRMSPSRSRKPAKFLDAKRSALNRAAYALKELKETRKKIEQLQKNIPRLEREYYKLARRAAFIVNANMKTGQLNPQELAKLRHVANTIRTMSTARRTLRRTPLPKNIQYKIVYKTAER